MKSAKQIPAYLARAIAVRAGVDPRTVQRVALGLSVRPLIEKRIREAMRAQQDEGKRDAEAVRVKRV